MDSTLDAFLRSWPFEPWLLASLLIVGVIYVRGWLILRRHDPGRWQAGRLAAFMGGLTAVFLALASPIEPFAFLLLQIHMAQHLLLTMVAPPLFWLGAPQVPLLRGMPESIRAYWIAPLIRSGPIRRIFRGLAHPFSALPLFVGATWLWHVPVFYEAALRSTGWHYLQHMCFLGTAMLFWYPVVRPYPGRPRWSLWLLFPYLILADVQNTILSALLTFSDRVLYAPYAQVPRLGGLSALEDQSAAGVLMWVPGSLVYLLPLFGIGIRLLYGESEKARRIVRRPGQRVPRSPTGGLIRLPILADIPLRGRSRETSPQAGFDLLRVPLLGRFLRWRHARLALQLPLGALAGILIYDGLHGPRVAPLNLAGVLPWIHWRGLVILGLLVAGNVSCMACPFTVPRTLARRWLPARHRWPRQLRSKWLAVALLVTFLWAYDAFALWDSPRWTAWIALGYFITAFLVDGLFRDASFCKYLCPIGQFNFVQSLVSPLQVRVRDTDVCTTCRTRDCIRGSAEVPGCEMGLFQPRKSSNMDCTFCLDCVHACPHDNVGILTSLPGGDLWNDPVRSGIGRFGERPDLAVLILVLVFGAFANAAGMVGPLVEWEDRLQSWLGQRSPLMVTSLYYLFALLILPLLTVGVAATLSRRWGQVAGGWLDVATRFSYSLVPLGFAMWLAHYGFHFLTSYGTVVPTMQRFAGDMGWSVLGEPAWSRACCRAVAEWVPRLEIISLDLGLLLSLYAGYRIALRQSSRPSSALKAFLPWGVLILLLFAMGVWIVLQPMQMRGTMLGAG
ncbi:MAG: cytochrome c oxidase assembly protein [Isosphaerales bacterium]